jgi:rhamnose utilization protein RhaD (predicted bifunctional aldolase and dehydrogenase)/NAD(P)-dependent dehydrogenase (short-subunit alcohol dehydrogenase family)
MVNELRANLLVATAPTPSVETLLHAFLPAKFVDHTHANAVLAVSDQPDGERICRELYGKSLVWVPYVMPGFALAKACAEAYEAAVKSGNSPTVMVLGKHGIFTFGETAKESYERMIQAVTRAERYIGDRRRTVVHSGPPSSPSREEDVLPRLRGVLAKLAGDSPETGPVLAVRAHDPILAFLSRPDAYDLTQVGCVTPDHVLRTKPLPLFVRHPDYADLARLTVQLENEVVVYARRYDAYFAEMCAKKRVTKTKLPGWPSVILLPEVGIIGVGKTRQEADIACDIYEHTVDVLVDAGDVGRYEPVSLADLFDVEYWSLEQAKLKPVPRPPLFGRVALVTGAAKGIGRATAERFLVQGAHVALVDNDGDELRALAQELAKKNHPSRLKTVVCDVTRAADVESLLGEVVRAFGGLDLVVSNAGNAPEGRLDTREGERRLRDSLELNLLAHNQVARASTAVMLAQGRGGCLLFNASKSAFNPGPNFGPYAVAKASLVALMRQYAVDLGPYGIRANGVNADRIRTHLFGGGVLESRAAARGLTVDDYFRANLLQREVGANDVADAFVYLATARSTTGCVLTVDGGNSAAFPR